MASDHYYKEEHEKEEKDEKKKRREEGIQPLALDWKYEEPGCVLWGRHIHTYTHIGFSAV